MSRRLPPHAHLDHLKKQAKDLLKAHRAGEPQALQRLKAQLHRLSRASEENLCAIEVTLQEAQFVIAREYGFDNWSALIAELPSTSSPSPHSPMVEGWIARGSHPQHYEMGGDPAASHSQSACGFISSKPAATSAGGGFGTLMKAMSPGNFLEKRLRMSGHVRTEDVDGWVGLWMRVDDASKRSLRFDNMQQRAIRGTTDWQRYEVVLDVLPEGVNIAFGIMLAGRGKAWVGDLQFEVVEEDVPITNAEVSPFFPDWFKSGSHGQDYETGGNPETQHGSAGGGYIQSTAEKAAGFGTLMKMIDPQKWLGTRLRMSGYVRSEDIDGWAGLWLRIDGPDIGKALGFYNMQDRPIKGTTDWKEYEIVLDVPENSIRIAFGILLHGKGKAWVDGLRFEEVDEEVAVSKFEYPQGLEDDDQ